MMGGNGEDLIEPPAGVEPATWWVEATRSIQLSYEGVGTGGTNAVVGREARLILPQLPEVPLAGAVWRMQS
jgi:hypothetical protein